MVGMIIMGAGILVAVFAPCRRQLRIYTLATMLVAALLGIAYQVTGSKATYNAALLAILASVVFVQLIVFPFMRQRRPG